MQTHRRHDISDRAWDKLEPHPPGCEGREGGVAHNNRQFFNGVFWIVRAGAPWGNLPPAWEAMLRPQAFFITEYSPERSFLMMFLLWGKRSQQGREDGFYFGLFWDQS